MEGETYALRKLKELKQKESTQKRIDIMCPSCGEPLVTDALFHDHAWCINRKCKYFIHVYREFDLMFSTDKIDFWDYVLKCDQSKRKPPPDT